jgi:hypothetical protein
MIWTTVEPSQSDTPMSSKAQDWALSKKIIKETLQGSSHQRNSGRSWAQIKYHNKTIRWNYLTSTISPKGMSHLNWADWIRPHQNRFALHLLKLLKGGWEAHAINHMTTTSISKIYRAEKFNQRLKWKTSILTNPRTVLKRELVLRRQESNYPQGYNRNPSSQKITNNKKNNWVSFPSHVMRCPAFL